MMRIVQIAKYNQHLEPEALKEMIVGCKNYDHKYQKIFYEQFYGFALKIVFRYIYRFERSIDVVNDGFVKVFRNIGQFTYRNESDLEKLLFGWLRRIMVNTAIDELRKKNMIPEIGAMPDYIWEEEDESGSADQLILYKELVNEIKKLPPSYRTVFNMFVIDGLSHPEIAELLSISVGTSKSSLSKARTQLQKFINQNSAEASRYAAFE